MWWWWWCACVLTSWSSFLLSRLSFCFCCCFGFSWFLFFFLFIFFFARLRTGSRLAPEDDDSTSTAHEADDDDRDHDHGMQRVFDSASRHLVCNRLSPRPVQSTRIPGLSFSVSQIPKPIQLSFLIRSVPIRFVPLAGDHHHLRRLIPPFENSLN